MDLDLVFQVKSHVVIIGASSNEDEVHYKTWETSNKFNLMFIRMSITSNIKSTIPKADNAKEFIKSLEERFQTVDKSLAKTPMNTMTTMKFDDLYTMHEHVIKMTNIKVRLKV